VNPSRDDAIVCDASAIIDLLLGTEYAAAVAPRLTGRRVIVPAHLDAMVLAALGRLQRTGSISARSIALRLDRLEKAPLERHAIGRFSVVHGSGVGGCGSWTRSTSSLASGSASRS
jgi:predicted nucleic acid-binding protein